MQFIRNAINAALARFAQAVMAISLALITFELLFYARIASTNFGRKLSVGSWMLLFLVVQLFILPTWAFLLCCAPYFLLVASFYSARDIISFVGSTVTNSISFVVNTIRNRPVTSLAIGMCLFLGASVAGSVAAAIGFTAAALFVGVKSLVVAAAIKAQRTLDDYLPGFDDIKVRANRGNFEDYIDALENNNSITNIVNNFAFFLVRNFNIDLKGRNLNDAQVARLMQALDRPLITQQIMPPNNDRAAMQQPVPYDPQQFLPNFVRAPINRISFFIQKIDLSDNDIRNITLPATLCVLKSLKLAGNKIISANIPETVLNHLKELDLTRNPLTAAMRIALRQIAANFPNLQITTSEPEVAVPDTFSDAVIESHVDAVFKQAITPAINIVPWDAVRLSTMYLRIWSDQMKSSLAKQAKPVSDFPVTLAQKIMEYVTVFPVSVDMAWQRISEQRNALLNKIHRVVDPRIAALGPELVAQIEQHQQQQQQQAAMQQGADDIEAQAVPVPAAAPAPAPAAAPELEVPMDAMLRNHCFAPGFEADIRERARIEMEASFRKAVARDFDRSPAEIRARTGCKVDA